MAGVTTFYIFSIDDSAWWAPDQSGLVEDHRIAGKYSAAEAIEIANIENSAFDGGYAEYPNVALVPVKE